MAGTSATILPIDEYQALTDVGTCTDAYQPLTIEPGPQLAPSLAECLRRCDDTSNALLRDRCATIQYNYHTKRCALMRVCGERYSLHVGQCLSWWLLRPFDEEVLRKLFPTQADPVSASAAHHCFFTRQPTAAAGSAVRRRRRNAKLWRDSQSLRSRMAQQNPNSTVCGASPLLQSQPGMILNSTWNRPWRYYSAVECGDATVPRVCLIFKKMGKTAVLGGLNSTDGLEFGRSTTVLRLESPWGEHMFTHNVAILRESNERGYVMMGGKQGFVSNATCRHEQGHGGPQARSSCLQLDSSSGIRLSRGDALPWSSIRWSHPTVALTGTQPTDCIDRRPPYTGYPKLLACEFDGRLSLVHTRGLYLLYARANLQFGAVSGGRFVQVSQSDRLEGGWQPWRPVHIDGVDQSKVDVYTFAVQRNPVDANSLLAIFPLAEPPWACVSIAVSIDGVTFSRPVTLRQAIFGVRFAAEKLEWRGEDHPVAGVVRAPNSEPGAHERILFYIHHAVKGTTARQGAVPHVRSYTLSVAELERLTADLLRELGETHRRR